MAEFRESYARFMQDSDYAYGLRQLCDFADFEDMDVGMPEIWSALGMVNGPERAKLRESGPDAPDRERTQCVIYAPGDTAYGIGRMYQSLAEYEGAIEVHICRSEAEALEQLKVPFASLSEMAAKGGFAEAVTA